MPSFRPNLYSFYFSIGSCHYFDPTHFSFLVGSCHHSDATHILFFFSDCSHFSAIKSNNPACEHVSAKFPVTFMFKIYSSLDFEMTRIFYTSFRQFSSDTSTLRQYLLLFGSFFQFVPFQLRSPRRPKQSLSVFLQISSPSPSPILILVTSITSLVHMSSMHQLEGEC